MSKSNKTITAMTYDRMFSYDVDRSPIRDRLLKKRYGDLRPEIPGSEAIKIKSALYASFETLAIVLHLFLRQDMLDWTTITKLPRCYYRSSRKNKGKLITLEERSEVGLSIEEGLKEVLMMLEENDEQKTKTPGQST